MVTLSVQTSGVILLRMMRRCLNVGSVGYPRHDFCSSYVIYDTRSHTITIRRLPFDFKHYIELMVAHKIDIPDWLAVLLMSAVM